MRRVILFALVAACGGSEPTPARPTAAAPADAGVAPDAFVFASLTGNRSPAALAFDKPKSTIAVDKPILRRAIRTRDKQIRACYGQQQATKPTLAGTVTVHFTIAETGDVSQAVATDVDPELDRCIEAEILQVKFPKPQGGDVVVNYPFTFHR